MMLFGEKYPDPVRMITMGDFSRELCGGTHLEETGQVDSFVIVSEESISSGTRRITALTGQRAEEYLHTARAQLQAITDRLGVAPEDVPKRLRQSMQHLRDLKKHLAGGGNFPQAIEPSSNDAQGDVAQLDDRTVRRLLREASRELNVVPEELVTRFDAVQHEIASLEQEAEALRAGGKLDADQLIADAETIGSVTVVVSELPAGNPALMRQLIDQIRKKTSPSAVLLATRHGDKALLVAGISRDLTDRVRAGDWIKIAAKEVGGSGGGKPDLAQAGGKNPDHLPQALDTGMAWIKEQLGP